MKKILCLLLTISLLGGSFFPAQAADGTIVEESVEYLEDGSYFTTVVISHTHTAQRIAALSSSTCSGSKTTTYKSKSGSKLWSVTVTGTFSYSGSSSRCTSSSVSATTYSSSWKVSNLSSSKSGNKASATATGTQYLKFTPVGSITKTVTLICSAKGYLS